MAQWEKNNKERAVNILSETLVLAEPEGYVRTFVDEGPPIAQCLSMLLDAQQRWRPDSPVSSRYVRKLLRALEQDLSGPWRWPSNFPNP